MNAPLWKGRVGESDRKANLFMTDVKQDAFFSEYDILASIAHAMMLKEQEILPSEEAKSLILELRKLHSENERGSFILDSALEDVHMNVESVLIGRLGDTGRRLHTARSRNDQVNTDMRLFLRSSAFELSFLVSKLARTLLAKIPGTHGIIIPAYTHTRRAQPITAAYYYAYFSHAFLARLAEIGRYANAINSSPLGSCAISGTSWPIDRKLTARLLAFDQPQENAFYAISSRGEQETKYAFALSMLANTVDKLASDIIAFSTDEYGLVNLPDRYCTGSSIMPQKKNPDVFELMRGRMAAIMSAPNQCLMTMRNLQSGHNADMQELKKIVISSHATMKETLELLIEIVPGITFNDFGNRLDPYMLATELADGIAQKGIPFRESHNIVGSCVQESAKKNIPFEDVLRNDRRIRAILSLEEIKQRLDPHYSIESRETSKSCVSKDAKLMGKELDNALKPLRDMERRWKRAKRILLSRRL